MNDPGSAPTASLASGRARLLCGAALFSTGGAAIKACSLPALEVAGLRSGIAVVALVLFMPSVLRGLGPRAFLVGLIHACTMVLFVQANKLTTAAASIFLQSTAPLFILLLGPWLLREPVRRRDLTYLLALAAGLALFFVGIDEPRASAPRPLLGNAAAALSSLGWASTIVGLRWLARSEVAGGGSAASAVVAGNLIAFLVASPYLLTAAHPGPSDWLAAAYLGVFQIALAYVLVTAGLRRLPALEASLYLMVEPVLNPVWAFLVQGERPGPWTLSGGGVILLATALKTLRDWKGAGAGGEAR